MKWVTYDDVLTARERIRDWIYTTPLEEATHLNAGGRRYFFKLECQQRLKSFKVRGAFARMTLLTPEEKARGVATVSSGNHGAAVSYAAAKLGIENAVIFVPEITPDTKVSRIRSLGGSVFLAGRNYDEAHAAGMRYIEEHGLTYIDPYDVDPVVYAGQGTIGLEILEQNPDIDTILVPIGGGGISTGIAVAAKAVKPGIRVIGVQTAACPAMIRSQEEGVCYGEYPITGESICESLTGGVGKLAFEMQKEVIDGYVTVEEATVRKAVAFMIAEEKTVAEGGSSTVTAAVMEHAEEIGGKNVALVVSGGNIQGELIRTLLNEYYAR